MARKPRFTVPGVPQHIIQRGNNREPCFFAEVDYQCYLDVLHEMAKRNHCHVHAYVLMTNHVHLLVTPFSEYSISHLMQDLGRKYVRYINHSYKRSGTLWEGRFKASLVDSDAYLLTCMRYIEMNPVRANMVNHPGEYNWSSYHTNAQDKPNTVITPHPLHESLGSTKAEKQHTYRELFRYHLDHTTLHDIREALNQELVLGRVNFKERIEQMTQRQTRPGFSGRPRVEEEPARYYIY